MISISLFADDLYRMTLPGVVAGKPKTEKGVEEITLEDGTIIEQSYAMLVIPDSAVKETITETGESSATVFLLMETEDDYYVTEQEVRIKNKSDGSVEVTVGLKKKDVVVYASDRDFVSGERVKLVEENEQVRLHMERQENEGEAVVSPYLKNRMYRNVIVGVILLVASAALLVAWKKCIPERISYLGYIVAVIWCVLVCACIKEFIVIPSEWIPRRLIDFSAWIENVRKYPI